MKGAVAIAALLLASSAIAQPRTQPEIAITIDDLPVHAPYPPGVTPLDVSRRMIAALKAAQVPATAFVNAVNAKDAETMQVLSEWRAAGFILGNHTWSHPHLSQLTIAQFEDEVIKDEPVLEKLGAGTDWRWFRYPFLDEGKDQAQRLAARQVLAKHGYRVGGVTMSFSDWAFTEAYARCTAAHDGAAVGELERMYMDSARENIGVSRAMARAAYGRDIPYVLLMHVSALSAKMMPQVIQLYRSAGFRLVSLAQAESDPAYRAYTDLDLPPPPSEGELAGAKAAHLPKATDYSTRLAGICPRQAT